eukprot:NODE_152_length_15391_cov_0.883272.p5 type:complete len:305 gc:universal NODE_152_length_15391_cov_0.883272:8928-9842(+)
MLLTTLYGKPVISDAPFALSQCSNTPYKVQQTNSLTFITTSYSYKALPDGLYDIYMDFQNTENVNITLKNCDLSNQCDLMKAYTYTQLKSGVTVNFTAFEYDSNFIEYDFQSSSSLKVETTRVEVCQHGKTDLDSCYGIRVCSVLDLTVFDYSSVKCRVSQKLLNVDYKTRYKFNLTENNGPIQGDPQLTHVFMSFSNDSFSENEMQVSADAFGGIELLDDKSGYYYPTLTDLAMGVRMTSTNASSITFDFGLYSEKRNLTQTSQVVCSNNKCIGWMSQACPVNYVAPGPVNYYLFRLVLAIMD